MTHQTDTDWIREGAEVVEYTQSIMSASVTLTTITKLTKTQIVLANGARYDRKRLRPVGDTAYRRKLLSADDEQVREVLAREQFQRMTAIVDGVLRDSGNGRIDMLPALDKIEQAVADARAAIDANARRVAEGSN